VKAIESRILTPRPVTLGKKGIPFVVIHSTSRKLKGYSVGLNGRLGGRLAAGHMISKGYTDVSLYLAQPRNPRYIEPAEGFREEWESSGKRWNDSMILKPMLTSMVI